MFEKKKIITINPRSDGGGLFGTEEEDIIITTVKQAIFEDKH